MTPTQRKAMKMAAEQQPRFFWDEVDGCLYEPNDTDRPDGCIPLYTAPHPTVPPGFKMVPVEPTEEMCNPSGEKGPVADMSAGYRKEIWKSMIATAPEAPQPTKREEKSETSRNHEPLTEEERRYIIDFQMEGGDVFDIARAIKRAHGITGETK